MRRFRLFGWLAILIAATLTALPATVLAFPSNTHANPWLILPPPDCPVTIPNQEPPPTRPDEANLGWHHKGPLWVGLPLNGVDRIGSEQIDDKGVLWEKMVWVRESVDAPLYVEAVLLSDYSVTAELTLAEPEGQRYVALQAMGIGYPRPGCWAVTGTFGYETLTVIIWVTTIYPIAME